MTAQPGRFFLTLLTALAGCGPPEPVVVLDREWSVDTATSACAGANEWQRDNAWLISRFGCEKLFSCRPMTAIANACLRDPVQQVRDFEAALATQFAATSECKSVALVDPANSSERGKAASEAMQKPHWSLGLDYSPGAPTQQWTMTHSVNSMSFAAGEGDPHEIAVKVCAVVRGAEAG